MASRPWSSCAVAALVFASALAACNDTEVGDETCTGEGCPVVVVPDPCLRENGGCDFRATCTVEDGEAVCGACPSGFDGTGESGCVDIDECATGSGSCDPLTRCTNTAGDFTCSACPLGYGGSGADGCVDIDECATDNGRCDPLTACTNTVGSRTCSDCPTGYTGNGSGRCLDINECLADNGDCDPHVICKNTAGSHTCGDCPEGYVGGGAGGCTDVNECATDNGGCDPQTTCTNTLGGRTCGDCPEGYRGTGLTACTDIDECATVANGGCDPLTTCANTAGGRTCSACPDGYSGTGTLGCVDHDECATANGGCSPLAACINLPGGSVCGPCPAGFSGTGLTGCTDIDECKASPNGGCDAMTTCKNVDGGRTCSACPEGYAGTGDTACTDIDECKTANGGCDRLTTCANTPGGRTCGGCPDGYTGDGATGCVDVDECAANNGGCGAQVPCTNTSGAHTCGNCPVGYTDGGSGNCVDIDECLFDNGGCGGSKYAACQNTVGGRICTDFDECAEKYGGCDWQFERCVNNNGAPHACVDRDECATDNGGCGPTTRATCTNQIGAPAICTDIDECATGADDCAADATCTNRNGGYGCKCNEGFVGNGKTCVVPPPVCAAGVCSVPFFDTRAFWYRRAHMQDGAITLVPDTAGFDKSGSFTVPAGVTSLTVYALGGGGGSNGDFGPSGSGGGAAQKVFAVTPGQVIPFAVGAGGTGTTYGGATPGTDTSVTVGNVTVTGGGGGAAGAPGGVGTGGDIVARGGQGVSREPGKRGEYVEGVCAGGSGGGAIDAGETNHVVGGTGGCYPAGGGGQGAPQYPLKSPGQRGENYGGGGGGGGNYGGLGGDGGGGYVMFSWSAATPAYRTNVAAIAVTAGAQLDTSAWAGIAGVALDDVSYGSSPVYAVSFDGRQSFVVYRSDRWYPIVRTRPADLTTATPGNGIWMYNTGDGWADCTDNELLACLEQAFVRVPSNRMVGEVLEGLSEAQWFEEGGFVAGTLDFAIGLHSADGKVSSSVAGIQVTPAASVCDANNGGCDVHATCTPRGSGSRTCECNAPYKGNGLTCAEPSICDGNADCGPHATCNETSETTYTCACNPGFTLEGTECVLVCGVNTQSLAGTLRDTNGALIGGTTNGLSLMIHAQSENGAADFRVTPSGDIAFCVPSGPIDFWLANFGYGFFNRNDLPNPRIPAYVWNISPALEWTAADGQLDLTLPAVIPVTVHVTSGGLPVADASVSSDTMLTSMPFILREATGTVTTANFRLESTRTDANGNAVFYVWPTDGQTFKVYASTSIHGVSLTSTIEGVPTEEGFVTVELPAPPQLLTGTLKDTNGDPIGGTSNGLSLMMRAQNADGAAETRVDANGNFSFYVPSGTVTVSLANHGYGFFNRNDLPNPRIPNYVWNIQPSVTWSAADGPLAFTLPAVFPVTVHVTSGGQPVANASVSSDTQLTTVPFTLHDSVPDTTALFRLENTATDANGNAVLMVWPTNGQTFTVYATGNFNGVSLTTKVMGVATAEGTVNIALPDPPQLLTGTLKDTNGNPITGTANGLSLMMRAQNADGAADSRVDANGAFSFYVPAGDVEVWLANFGYGFFNRNDLPNPLLPSYVWNVSPSITWTSADGPLALTLPTVVPITVHVSTEGQPVPGARVVSNTQLTTLPFTLHAASGTQTTAQFRNSEGPTTDANGDAKLYVWATNGQTFTVEASATFSGVSIHGSTPGVAADGLPHAVEIVLTP